QTEEQVVHAVGVASRAVGREVLQVELELRKRVRVEQLAQLGLPQERAQLRRVDGQRLRASLRERRVAFVDEVANVREEEGGREGRRRPRVHRDDANVAAADAAQDLDERGHVEDILEALAIRLEDDRERAEARGDLHELGRAAARVP